tara:strand:+ start:1103 stop:1375 length:273 start_codon:yes stop_codon:yes gene_type:complete
MKDNKLIAEFMGFTKDSKDLYLIDDYNLRGEDEYQATYVSEMKFHTSWDWLMPVMAKIVKDYGDGWIFEEGYDLKVRYKAVVKFIKSNQI